jgi:hypothetical protein
MAFQSAEGSFVAQILNGLDQELAVNLVFKAQPPPRSAAEVHHDSHLVSRFCWVY